MDKEDLVNHYLKKLNSTDIIKYIFTLNIIKELSKYMNMKTTLLIALLYRYIKFYSLIFKSIFLYKSFICRKISGNCMSEMLDDYFKILIKDDCLWSMPKIVKEIPPYIDLLPVFVVKLAADVD